jgi:hypothetical protein
MSTRAVYTTLWCSQCLAETTHLVLYAGLYLKAITCTSCQRTLQRPQATLRRMYVHDLSIRARKLAGRTVHEARHHPIGFLKHLPKHLILKPLAISSEVYAIFSEPE